MRLPKDEETELGFPALLKGTEPLWSGDRKRTEKSTMKISSLGRREVSKVEDQPKKKQNPTVLKIKSIMKQDSSDIIETVQTQLTETEDRT